MSRGLQDKVNMATSSLIKTILRAITLRRSRIFHKLCQIDGVYEREKEVLECRSVWDAVWLNAAILQYTYRLRPCQCLVTKIQMCEMKLKWVSWAWLSIWFSISKNRTMSPLIHFTTDNRYFEIFDTLFYNEVFIN